MRTIRLENVTKSKNGIKILDNVSLTIPGGEFFALLGPSGCGKTTLLRLIAGFETVDSGKIFIGDREITHLPTHERSVNIVFQNYALFPHLSVFDNVAYSLSIAKCPKAEIEARVLKLLKAFGLEAHIDKLPSALSGGQQQRVALARAIINKPDVLLLDEPLAALDFNLREKMLIELIEWQDELSTTFLYVTHDQFEALTVADHLALMNYDGDIEQIGTPKEIYEFPKSSFVTKFVGSTNIFHGILDNIHQDPHISVPNLGRFKVHIPQKKEWIQESGQAVISLRPEKVYISKSEIDQNFSNSVKGIVDSIVYHGRSTQYNVRLPNGSTMSVFEQNEEHFTKEDIDYEDQVSLYWQEKNSVLLER